MSSYQRVYILNFHYSTRRIIGQRNRLENDADDGYDGISEMKHGLILIVE
jgi:hypothetical protein